MTLEELFDAVKHKKPIEQLFLNGRWEAIHIPSSKYTLTFLLEHLDRFRLAPQKWARERRAQELGATIQKQFSLGWLNESNPEFPSECFYRIHPDYDEYFDEAGELKVTLPPIVKRKWFRERVAQAHGATIEYFVSGDSMGQVTNAAFMDPYNYRIHPLQDHLFNENGIPKPTLKQP